MDYSKTDKSQVHPSIQRYAEYCQTLGQTNGLPNASDFRLSEAHWLFGFINIVDVLHNGADYRYASCGTFWKLMLGYDLTGARLSELEAVGRLQALRPNYDDTVRERSPSYRSADLIWPGGIPMHIERLVVPFAGEDGQVAMLTIAAQSECSLQELCERRRHGEAQLILKPSQEAVAA